MFNYTKDHLRMYYHINHCNKVTLKAIIFHKIKNPHFFIPINTKDKTNLLIDQRAEMIEPVKIDENPTNTFINAAL